MRGRKPLPAHLRLIAGNDSHRPVDASVDRSLGADAPTCPAHLTAPARAEWKRIVPHLMRARLLTQVDRAALALYCTAYARWKLAEEKIAAASKEDADGRGVVKYAANGYEQLSMWVTVSNRAQEQVLKYLSEFGMSPSSRARVSAVNKQGSLFPEDDPMEGVLGASRNG